MGKKVWVVEDDPSIAEIIAYTLEDDGFVVGLFSSAATFIDALKSGQNGVDIFVLDVRLPDGSGLELCRMVREHPIFSEVPVLIMSAHADGDEVERTYPVNGFISKPFDLDDFSKQIALNIAS